MTGQVEDSTGAGATAEIRDEAGHQAAIRVMDRQQRPPSILRFLMGGIELYRQARKIGWSRPWNKYGINTFLSFKLGFPQDDDLVERARAVLAEISAGMPALISANSSKTF